MKGYRKFLFPGLLVLLLVTFACVTINIYFPAEEVRSVAGEIVTEIRGKKTGEEEPGGEGAKNSFLMRTLRALGPSLAWAQDVTQVSNPTIRALKAKMKARFTRMKPFYGKGMLVEGDSGYLALGNVKGQGLKVIRDLKNLVAAENSDRAALYAEVAKALKIDASQVDRVARIFAKEWQKSF